MKRTLLFALALAVIPVGVDAQVTGLAQLRARAEQGDAIAQFDLGLRYMVGRDVPESDVEAVRWYRLAAEQGLMSAQNNLGIQYELGEGVPKDDVLSYMWLNLAAAQGDKNAQNNKDRVEQRMTREQISEAQRLSIEWFEAHPPGGD